MHFFPIFLCHFKENYYLCIRNSVEEKIPALDFPQKIFFINVKNNTNTKINIKFPNTVIILMP